MFLRNAISDAPAAVVTLASVCWSGVANLALSNFAAKFSIFYNQDILNCFFISMIKIDNRYLI